MRDRKTLNAVEKKETKKERADILQPTLRLRSPCADLELVCPRAGRDLREKEQWRVSRQVDAITRASHKAEAISCQAVPPVTVLAPDLKDELT